MAHMTAALLTGFFLLVSLCRGTSDLDSLFYCGFFISNHSLALLLSCPQPQQLGILSKVQIQSGITLTPVGTTLRLENITTVTLEPPPILPSIKTLPVEIKHCGLSALQLLPSVASASHLLLNLSDIGLRLGEQDEFAGIGRVTWLDLSNNRIVDVPSDAFNSLSGLLVLDLSSNMIDYLSNDSFCQLSMLRVLDIRDNPMLMTFALLQLPSLESLDSSMSVVEIGVFCRMNNLKRVVLHRPLDRLQCFVFDSLPSLKELSFSYFSVTNQICFTMMCDPHPVLNQRVPFNFTINQLNSDGSVAKTVTNIFLRMFTAFTNYRKVCKTNYETYYQHHDNGMPLTTGCLQFEHLSPRCSLESSSRSPPLCSLRSSKSLTTPPSIRFSASREAATQPSCRTELAAVIAYQDRVLIALYAAIGALLLCVILITSCFLLKRYHERRHPLTPQQQQHHHQSLVPPLQIVASETLQVNGKESLMS